MKPRSLWKKVQLGFCAVFVPIYPIAFGGIIVYSKFIEATSLAISIFFGTVDAAKVSKNGYTIEPGTAVIWLTLAFWLRCYFFQRKGDEEDAEYKLDTILARYPRLDIFERGKKYIEVVNTTINSLGKYDNNFKKGVFIDGEINDLISSLTAATKLINKLTGEFFNQDENTISSNFMLYFDKDENPKLVEQLIGDGNQNGKILHFRKDKEQYLNGVLYLAPALYIIPRQQSSPGVVPFVPDLKAHDLKIPIYSREPKIFNHEKCTDDRNTILGAPMAFFEGLSAIPDTKTPKAYKDFDTVSQKEITHYFDNVSPETRSLISLRVPVVGGNCLCVFNLEASTKDAFDLRPNFLKSFGSVIHPYLTAMSKYLEFYKQYLILKIENTLKTD